MHPSSHPSRRSIGAGLRATIATLAVACVLTTVAGISRTMDHAAGEPLRRPTTALSTAGIALGMLA
jgi:hypothetical protein